MSCVKAVWEDAGHPKIAFLPCFKNYGETYPLIALARRYREMGGEAVFIGYPDEYDRYARELGFRIIELPRPPSRKATEEYRERLVKYYEEDSTLEKIYPSLFRSIFDGEERIQQEIEIFQREGIKAVVASFSLTPLISARVVKLPLIMVLSGVATPSFFKANKATFPDGYENSLTRLVPRRLKNLLTNQYILHCKWGVKACNELAEKHHTPPVHRFLDLFCGDEAIVLDNLEFVGLSSDTLTPHEHFVGPIIPEDSTIVKGEAIDAEVQALLDAPGRTVLVALGTFRNKNMFLDIITALQTTDYKVLASYKNLVDGELPPSKPNVLLREVLPLHPAVAGARRRLDYHGRARRGLHRGALRPPRRRHPAARGAAVEPGQPDAQRRRHPAVQAVFHQQETPQGTGNHL